MIGVSIMLALMFYQSLRRLTPTKSLADHAALWVAIAAIALSGYGAETLARWLLTLLPAGAP